MKNIQQESTDLSHIDLGVCPTSGKKRFRSRKVALKVLNAQLKSIQKWGAQGRKGDGAKTAYRCPYCADWHLTKAAYREREGKAS